MGGGRDSRVEIQTVGSVEAAGQRPNARKGVLRQYAIRSSNGTQESEGEEVCIRGSKRRVKANKTHGKKGGLEGVGE